MENTVIIDLFVIGGGINGVGIATDAAGRGLTVMLCEQDDLAHATSSKSSKLIHGGLRYLEYYEFRLVKEALKEREVLLKKAPHIIHPLLFIMPHNAQLKPMWLLRIGLFLYDHLSKRRLLPASYAIDFYQHSANFILKKIFTKGFVYTDCSVDDSRLVVLNAMLARQKGATIFTRTRFISAKRLEQRWEITIEHIDFGVRQIIHSKALVNATGPWVEKIINQSLGLTSQNHLSLVKGSHIVVPKLYADKFAFILLNPDNRVVFVIPYLEKYTLIGTTDIPFDDNPHNAEITDTEINYLCDAVNGYFEQKISPKNILWHYSGVRALHSDHTTNISVITRDYYLELNIENEKLPLLSVFGGKITTYRTLAEQAMHKLKPFFPHMGDPWTANAPLPGGDLPNADFTEFYQQFQQKYPWLPSDLAQRYAKNYGTLANQFLNNSHRLDDLGKNFGCGLYEKEVAYLIEHEWAKTAEDILWRRTKLGLCFSVEQLTALKTTISTSYFSFKNGR